MTISEYPRNISDGLVEDARGMIQQRKGFSLGDYIKQISPVEESDGIENHYLNTKVRVRDNEQIVNVPPYKSYYEATKDTNPKDAIGMTKLPVHLVSGIVKAYQAIAHYLGNIKYGAWNYRAMGARASVYRAALDRHMDAWWEGEEDDPVDGTPHLANALACINILIEAKEAGKLLDDRPPKSNYRNVSDRMTAVMAKINAKYGHLKPVHHYEDKGVK